MSAFLSSFFSFFEKYLVPFCFESFWLQNFQEELCLVGLVKVSLGRRGHRLTSPGGFLRQAECAYVVYSFLWHLGLVLLNHRACRLIGKLVLSLDD